MSEKRKSDKKTPAGRSRPTNLPVDYLRMVQEVFSTNFSQSLEALRKLGTEPRLELDGDIFADEIVLRCSLLFNGKIAATTAYASSDFDPTASSPKLEELLGSCVDALGAVFSHLLDPTHQERLEQLISDSLSALEDIPFEWTKTEINHRDIYIRVDKANPALDKMADDWLAQNDPEMKARLQAEQESSEELMEDRVTQIQEDKNRRGNGPTYH